jgi:hypothetical protein
MFEGAERGHGGGREARQKEECRMEARPATGDCEMHEMIAAPRRFETTVNQTKPDQIRPNPTNPKSRKSDGRMVGTWKAEGGRASW